MPAVLFDPASGLRRAPDPAAIAAAFRETGAVVLLDAVPAPLCAALDIALADHYGDLMTRHPEVDPVTAERGDAWDQFQTDVVPWAPTGGPFDQVAALPVLDDATRACAGDGYFAYGALAMLTFPGGLGQAWHQDCPPRDVRAWNCNRLVYPRTVGADDGAIVWVPGSHRRGLLPEGPPHESLPGEVAFTPPAGTLIVLHGHVFHRVLASRSGRPRLSVNFRAYPAGTPPDICNTGVYRNAAYHFPTRTVVDRADLGVPS